MNQHDPIDVPKIQVRVNGRPREIEAGLSVLGLLERLGLNPDHVVVEMNGGIVLPEERAASVVPPGAVVEIVRFVGGG